MVADVMTIEKTLLSCRTSFLSLPTK